MSDDIYDLEELIEKLEDIRELKEGFVNFPKAFLTLALEIKELKCKAALHEKE